MKLQSQLNLPGELARLIVQLNDLMLKANSQVNMLTEGRISAVHNAATAAPTTGTHAQGDKVWKSLPVEAGAATTKYVILGWVCTASGTPGTWLEMRVLTGN